MSTRVHIGLILAAALSTCAQPTPSSDHATRARSPTEQAPVQAAPAAPPVASVAASGAPEPQFVGARYGSLLVRENAPAMTRTRVSYPVMIEYAIYECKS